MISVSPMRCSAKLRKTKGDCNLAVHKIAITEARIAVNRERRIVVIGCLLKSATMWEKVIDRKAIDERGWPRFDFDLSVGTIWEAKNKCDRSLCSFQIDYKIIACSEMEGKWMGFGGRYGGISSEEVCTSDRTDALSTVGD